jgi:2-polyprenyl-6-hydroxyphenyl methylase/3-demethylubiquinone-9 3-methyltransferase
VVRSSSTARLSRFRRTDDQAETDRLWNAIVRTAASACGWCKDKWGLSWQITPRPHGGITDPDRAAAKRVFKP